MSQGRKLLAAMREKAAAQVEPAPPTQTNSDFLADVTKNGPNFDDKDELVNTSRGVMGPRAQELLNVSGVNKETKVSTKTGKRIAGGSRKKTKKSKKAKGKKTKGKKSFRRKRM